MQVVTTLGRHGPETMDLPDARSPIGFAGLAWGSHEELCTPAYWAAQAWMLALEQPAHYRLGRSLEEEALACLLGGHGMPAEVGLAAYRRLRDVHAGDAGRLRDATEVEALLREPLSVRGRAVRYRFPAQKARFVAAAMTALPALDAGVGDRALRDALTSLPGIGPKTASWIVRNRRDSDEVAILDVHILRAGRILGIFDPRHRVERHYGPLETAFLRFAACISARASILDSVMWSTMRDLPAALLRAMPNWRVPDAPHRVADGRHDGWLTPG